MQIQDDKPYDDINITPMLDLAYVLLVIFILMCTASVQGLKVDVPKVPNKADPLGKPKTKSITVNSEGKVFLNTTPVTLDQLASELARFKAKEPNFPVVLKGDATVQYQPIMDVLTVLGNLDITDVGMGAKGSK